MRFYISVALSFLTFICCAQGPQFMSKHPDFVDDLPFDETGKLIFEEVVPADHGQQQLYQLARVFFAKAFKSADAVIQFDDKETATVIGKGYSEIFVQSLTTQVATRMFYTLTIQCKEKKYRYEISDIYYKSYPTAQFASVESGSEAMFHKSNYYKKNGKPRPIQESYKDATLDAVHSLISQVVEALNFSKPLEDW